MFNPRMIVTLLITVVVFASTLVGTLAVLGFLERRAILDHPNARSSHEQPTPHGGGLAIVGVVVPALCLAAFLQSTNPLPVYLVSGLAFALAIISWIDDLRDLNPAIRFFAQFIAVGLSLAVLPPPHITGFIPPALEQALVALAWVWFINLYNFMDGIDGIAGVETASIGLGIAGVALVAGLAQSQMSFGLILAAAAIWFLRWNWHPARIFMGDVGSIPLGFLLGWLLIELVQAGHGLSALILPLYYLVDATWTLLARAVRGEKVWQAHKSHFYQKAVQSGHSHADVCRGILMANIALVALALAALHWPWSSLFSAVLIVGALIRRLLSPRDWEES